jgi:hypothetical protein
LDEVGSTDVVFVVRGAVFPVSNEEEEEET